MYGVVTRNVDELNWSEFDRGFYEIKDVTGRRAEPVETGTNMMSCFGDTARGELDSEMVPRTADGDRATREQPYFDWGYICPTRTAYREELLDIVDDAVAHNPDLRIDDIGFPRAEYCYCEACQAAFEQSSISDWGDWRSSVITSFVREVSDRVPGRLSATVYPNPFPGHLKQRAGVDLAAIEPHLDELVIPLYDLHYGTTYWLEILASGFEQRISISLSIELYAVNVDLDRLAKATEVAAEYADDVFFGYDAGTGRGVIRRLHAEASEGDTYGSPENGQ